MKEETSTPPASDPMADISKSVEQTVKSLFDTTLSAASKALQGSSETFEDGKQLVNQGVQRGVSLVRKYPLESAVVCLGVGYLVGRLVSKRD